MATVPRPGIALTEAVSSEQVAQARELFLEYANSLDFSLCFQSFDEEMKGLPGAYAPPEGRLLLAYSGGQAAGCIALRPLDDGICEMKRLFVRPGYRGQGVGRVLVDAIISEARNIGYKSMRLDTVATSMQDAIAIYRRRGFREIPPYRANPVESVIYLELLL